MQSLRHAWRPAGLGLDRWVITTALPCLLSLPVRADAARLARAPRRDVCDKAA